MAKGLRDFLLEVGTEPMPARFIIPALAQLAARLQERLKEAGLPFGAVRTSGTLRRLAVLMEEVADRYCERQQKVKGPPARLWRDADGKFTPQAAGFARKQGLEPQDLRVDGEFLWAETITPGESAAAVLARSVPEALRRF